MKLQENLPESGSGTEMQAPTSTLNVDITSSKLSGVSTEGLNNYDSNFSVEKIEPKILGYRNVPHGFTVRGDPFFQKPVVLGTYTWSAASTDGAYINPWKAWINNAMIQQRIRGYTRFRASRLHLRFDITATPYHYGRIRPNFRFLQGPAGSNPANFVKNEGKSRASQCLGVDIDAALPGSKELEIPWVYFLETITITQTGGFNAFGFLWMTVLSTLAQSNAVSPDSVYIVIRAWCDDVELSGPTRVPSVVQSKRTNTITSVPVDEITSGPISSVATAFANAGQALSKVPIIGGVATMVAKGGRMVSDFASMFGFSKVRTIFDPMLMIRSLSPWATLDGKISSIPLSFYDKQGLTTDVSDMGVSDVDPMSLQKIFSHSSLVDQFAMTTSQARGTLLRTIYVFPTASLGAPSGAGWNDTTSLAFGVLPFKFWRGTIEYDIEVVCSNFHTGQLRVVYEPDPTGIIDASWPIGASENCVINIQSGAKAQIKVRWSSKFYWAQVLSQIGPATTGVVDYSCNGMLMFYVENQLLGMNDISILVYIKAGEDFEVFDLQSPMPYYICNTAPVMLAESMEDESPESLAEFVSTVESAIVGNKTLVTNCEFGGVPDTSSTLSMKTFGERIVSLRALLKRFVGLGYILANSDTSAGTLQNKNIVSMLDLHPPDMSHTAAANVGMVYFSNEPTIFRYFRPGFLGTIGGARYRITDGSKLFSSDSTQAAPSVVGIVSTYNVVTGGLVANGTVSNSTMRTFNNGSAVFDGVADETTDVEVPDYNYLRFRLAGCSNTNITSNDGRNYVRVNITKPIKDMTDVYHYVHHSVADDFSFVIYLGAPNLIQYTPP